MLGEIALTPGVFFAEAHDNPETMDIYLQMLKEPLLQEMMVRNLCAGGWYRCLTSPDRGLSPRAKELLKKLHAQKRLRGFPVCRSEEPDTDIEWCLEALASHEEEGMDCILTTSSTKTNFSDNGLVTNLERIYSHPWWTNRATSVRLCRTTQDYRKHLGRLLNCANSVMFVDPHFDPAETRYAEFWRLLECANRPVVPVRVEIHRVCRKRDSRERGGWRVVPPTEWESIFKTNLAPKLVGLSIHVEVFIWDDFHDRYLISDLMGISVPNGFDIDRNENNLTTWSRLARSTRDDVQREFSSEDGRHRLHHQFKLFPQM